MSANVLLCRLNPFSPIRPSLSWQGTSNVGRVSTRIEINIAHSRDAIVKTMSRRSSRGAYVASATLFLPTMYQSFSKHYSPSYLSNARCLSRDRQAILAL
jgi:hypothetical protein